MLPGSFSNPVEPKQTTNKKEDYSTGSISFQWPVELFIFFFNHW
jgi:hypothetical protein